MLALSPGPFPAFQCCTLKCGRAWYAKSQGTQGIDIRSDVCRQAKDQHLCERSLHRRSLAKKCTNKPSVRNLHVAWNGQLHKATFGPHCMTCACINHVISRARPSCFSACNIEKLRMGLGTGLVKHKVITLDEQTKVHKGRLTISI